MDAAIFDDLTALADATRSRMLLVLERLELTVGELCAVLQLPTVSSSRSSTSSIRLRVASASAVRSSKIAASIRHPD